jgi:hypothetical protein
MTPHLTGKLRLALLLAAAVTARLAGIDRPFSTAGAFVGPRAIRAEFDAATAGI